MAFPKNFEEFSYIKSLGFSDSKIAELTKAQLKLSKAREEA